ncbi:L-lactate dehydrogenase [Paenibacillus pasadenensis]|uniref:L-lactate dehydrogenase n=1 Tax=Paenibacillus pasadenensis TaxID=217090 RepID=UPI0020403BCB|nr:L-lactate dehydrogenase [Paenibacillus pasadenensis]MCM3747676.1 L-lactate dehydrogenase [Paenibacillus pasadenensis]
MAGKLRKAAIIGAGYVGASCAYAMLNQSLCDEIMLVGRSDKRTRAQAQDLSHCVDFSHSRTQVYAGTLEQCGDMDLIVLCAGGNPVEGGSRLDLLDSAYEIYRDMIGRMMASGFDGIFLVATNPVDIVTYMVWKLSGLPRERVIGSGTSIDTARLKTLLSEHLPVDPRSVQGYVMGEHGESQFVVWSHVTVGGKPLSDIISQHPQRFGNISLDDIERRTRNAGWDILLGKGSTHYGIAAALTSIARSIFNNDCRIAAVSAVLDGEYGAKDIGIGVPAIIGRSGIQEVLELRLNDAEQLRFAHSCAVIREAIQSLPELQAVGD